MAERSYTTPRIALVGGVPVGSIVPWIGGYFTAAANVGFTSSLANTVAALNAILPPEWKVCNGAALNDSQSPIWNAASRFLPDLTDDRFLQGSTAAGTTGGTNDATHSHAAGTLSIASSTGGATASFSAGTIWTHDHTMVHTHIWARKYNSFDDGTITERLFTYSSNSVNAAHAMTYLGNEASFATGMNDGSANLQDGGPRAVISRNTATSGSFSSFGNARFGPDNDDSDYNTDGIWFTGGVARGSPDDAYGEGSSAKTSPTNLTGATLNGAQSNHSHSISSTVSGSTANSAFIDNRPKYLQVFYIVKIK